MFRRILIANRGEIAIRIARAAAEMGIASVAVYSPDDAASLHRRMADAAVPLRGHGAAAYLNIAQIVAAARAEGCDAIHPGYGFLSENAGFARACAEAGITFIGPRPDLLQLFGDKTEARKLAERLQVPLLPGTRGATSLAEAEGFLASLGPQGAIMVKAIAGGGGRGMRAVGSLDALGEAFARCQSEAQAAFGQGDVYVERLIRRARHIEVQVLGDASGTVTHLHERECSIQRRHQKLLEIAPSPFLDAPRRQAIIDAALRMAKSVGYNSLGTFEFLVDEDGDGFYFMEANPRLQVEHTVTEEVTGVDLVQAQIAIAAGATLAQLGLLAPASPRGHAIQLRVNMERLDAQGNAFATGGVLQHFEPPNGPGVRVDSFGYQGYATSTNFDSLLAKVIVHARTPSFADAAGKAARALREFRIEGVETNLPLLQALLQHPDVLAGKVHTRFLEDNIAALLAMPLPATRHAEAGAAVQASGPANAPVPAGTIAVAAPMRARLLSFEVEEGALVQAGTTVAVLEAMKMELSLPAGHAGRVLRLLVPVGETVEQDRHVLLIEPVALGEEEVASEESLDLDHIRADLQAVIDAHAPTLDANRPRAVERRRRTGGRMARENIEDLCDDGSFVEYGALTLAAQRARRSLEELVEMSPADGLIAGIGSINGALFDDANSRAMVMAYDYTVFAGTQGFHGHKKTDRMLQLAEKLRLPLVLFAEGGGGRPGEVDVPSPVNLANMSFWHFARLSGLVPLVGIVSGRCFAGNAAMLGCCDVVIATENSSIGMGGPAMIEGGGLGRFSPEEVGPVSFQAPNGVIDILVPDEAAAVAVAKQYLSYFQGPVAQWSCPDQRLLRQIVPERRTRAYEVRDVIDVLADSGSVLEIRRDFGLGLVTAFMRIEGHPIGVIANNPMQGGGAVASAEADKASRFVELCDAFDIPVLSLCDTPGFMVGPDSERQAAVRHVCRMFLTAASIDIPFFTVVLRKAYGLGAQAMAGGGFHGNNSFTVAWPSGEIGAMGLEGAVQLAYRNELAAIADEGERQARYQALVDDLYARGKALNIARFLSLDDVIDPAETRRWIMRGLKAQPPRPDRHGKKRPNVDAW